MEEPLSASENLAFGDDTPEFALREQVAHWLPAVPILSAQLEETARQIEDAVVSVCRTFRSIAQRASDSASHSRAVLGQASDAGKGDVIATAVTTIQNLVTRLEAADQVARQTVEQMKHIEAMSEQIGQIRTSLADVDSVASALHILALNAKIEAARAGERGAAFGVVATETSRLAQQASACTRQVRGLVRSLHKNVSQTTQAVTRETLGDLEALTAGRTQALEAVEVLSTSHTRMTRLMSEAAENSHRLASDVEDAITSLQFQDAVNQRVAHVVETLHELRGELDQALEAAGGPPDTPAAEGWQDRLQQRYTMAAERDLLGGAGESPGEGDAELGGSIVLF